MKKISFIIFFLLFFQNLSYSDTISEYEEAGLKLGKSILEVMTFEKIIESVVDRSKDERYLTVEYVPDNSVYPNLDFNGQNITDMKKSSTPQNPLFATDENIMDGFDPRINRWNNRVKDMGKRDLELVAQKRSNLFCFVSLPIEINIFL